MEDTSTGHIHRIELITNFLIQERECDGSKQAFQLNYNYSNYYVEPVERKRKEFVV